MQAKGGRGGEGGRRALEYCRGVQYHGDIMKNAGVLNIPHGADDVPHGTQDISYGNERLQGTKYTISYGVLILDCD